MGHLKPRAPPTLACTPSPPPKPNQGPTRVTSRAPVEAGAEESLADFAGGGVDSFGFDAVLGSGVVGLEGSASALGAGSASALGSSAAGLGLGLDSPSVRPGTRVAGHQREGARPEGITKGKRAGSARVDPPPGSMVNNGAPIVTVSPSSTRNSVMVPPSGAFTSTVVYKGPSKT